MGHAACGLTARRNLRLPQSRRAVRPFSKPPSLASVSKKLAAPVSGPLAGMGAQQDTTALPAYKENLVSMLPQTRNASITLVLMHIIVLGIDSHAL
ncbi:hypothetical protein P280DRAFT_522667 [Massarina eburnea CBS 473.64]|uniref:Uncharacterized protein n=1 Tax=Massarina eburnea CBS 473.64 TaxID=1395130 RepID=A0A6A6RNZ0_9PLEO|nr:hypothetical protein P280DRAFT_522667 [Massarina eburnea CBS 473.64]